MEHTIEVKAVLCVCEVHPDDEHTPWPGEVERLSLTGRVDVEVSGLVSHVPCGLQTRSSGVHLAGVAHVLGYIHRVRTLVNVLTGKQHLDLREEAEVEPKSLAAISPYLSTAE